MTEYRQLLDWGKIFENEECSFCGEHEIISVEYLSKLKNFAERSPHGMSRFMNVDHGAVSKHKRNLYFDRNGKYVNEIILPTNWGGWYPGDSLTNPDKQCQNMV